MKANSRNLREMKTSFRNLRECLKTFSRNLRENEFVKITKSSFRNLREIAAGNLAFIVRHYISLYKMGKVFPHRFTGKV